MTDSYLHSCDHIHLCYMVTSKDTFTLSLVVIGMAGTCCQCCGCECGVVARIHHFSASATAAAAAVSWAVELG